MVKQNKHFLYLLILPSLILIILLIGYPFLEAIYLSFTDKRIGAEPNYIGLKNFIALISDSLFWKTIGNTIQFTIISIFLKLLIGLLIALSLIKLSRSHSIVSAVLLIPWIIPTVISALIWLWIFYDIYGVMNYILSSIGIIHKDISWLGSSKYALYTIILANVWRESTFFSMFILFGIKNIPQNIIYSADLDTNKFWYRLYYIIFPNIKYVFLVLIFLSSIWTMGEFQLVHIMTRGGPSNSTQLFSTLIYEFGINNFDIGKAMSLAVIFLPLFLQLVFLLNIYFSKNEK